MSIKDRQIQRLIKKAFPQKKAINRNGKGKSTFLPDLDPERFYVFRRLKLSSGIHVGILVLVFLIIPSIFFSLGWEAVLISLAGLLVFCFILFLGFSLWFMVSFRGWRSRLSYQLTGWEELVNHDHLYCDLCWSSTSIKIETSPNADPEAITALLAALTLFCKKANNKYYTRDTDADDSPSCDPRNAWEIRQPGTNSDQPHIIRVGGDSCPEVINIIYKLLRGNLDMLNRKIPGLIRRVELHMASSYREVDIDTSYTGTG